MALTAGDIVAYIRADASQFDATVNKSKGTFETFGNTVGAGVKALATTFTAVTAATAGLGLAAFKVGASYNILQQNSRAALATLLGGAEAANVQMGKLDDFASNSPFAKQVFITAQQQLLGFGVQAEKVIPILDAVQNSVAAVGGGNEQVSQVTYALAQMQGQGKLTGETLNQLGQYGIDAAGIIGAKMGKTGAEIREMASKPGGIPVDQVWAPLVDGMMERFGGATAGIKEQFTGAVDRIKGAWRDVGAALATPFIDPKGGGMAVEWANKIADALRALQQKAEPLVDLLVERFRPALDKVTPALDKVRSGINSWDLSKINGQLDTLVKYKPLVAGTAASLIAFGSSSLGPISKLLPAINPVIAGIAALVATTPGLQGVGKQFMASLEPLVPIAQDLGKTLIDSLMSVLEELAPAVSDVAVAAGPLALALANGLTPAAVSVAEAMVPIAGVLADVVSWIAELPTPVLAAAVAFLALSKVEGPVSDLASTVTGKLGDAFKGMTTVVRDAQAASLAAGGSVGAMGMTMQVAKVGAQNLGTALKTAFMSNPIGLAIAGISVAFGFLMNAQEKARQKAEEHEATVRELTDAFVESNGEIDKNARQIAHSTLATKEYSETGQNAIDMAKDLGVSLSDLNLAWLGDADAIERVKKATEGVRTETEAYTSGTSGVTTQVFTDQAEAAQWLVESLEDGAGASDEARQAAIDLAAGTGELTDKTNANTEATKAATEAKREWAGIVLSEKEATRASEEAQLSATDAITKWQAAVENATLINADAKATEEEKGAATRDAEQALRDAEAATDSTSTATLKAVDAMKLNAAGNREVYDTVMAARESFIAQKVALGMTREAAEAYATQLGLTPEAVLTKIEIEDLATQTINTVISKLEGMNGKTYTAIARVDTQGNTRSVYIPGVGTMSANGSMWEGGLQRYANGGGIDGAGASVARVSQIVQGGRNILWGEPETGWETYISGKPDQRNRNLRILDETARRFGRITVPANVTAYASGGSNANAPTPTMFVPTSQGPVDLSDRSVQRLADAILAGATQVSNGVADARDRSMAGTRQTIGRTR